MNFRKSAWGIVGLACIVSGSSAEAGDLIYVPINPSFGGSPLNSGHLLGIAGAQREATASDAGDDLDGGALTTDGPTSNPTADLFVRQLQSRLLSGLASQVTEAIFGDNPQDQGTVTFGDTTVRFERTLDSINLTIVDALDGTVTEISVPQLVTAIN